MCLDGIQERLVDGFVIGRGTKTGEGSTKKNGREMANLRAGMSEKIEQSGDSSRGVEACKQLRFSLTNIGWTRGCELLYEGADEFLGDVCGGRSHGADQNKKEFDRSGRWWGGWREDDGTMREVVKRKNGKRRDVTGRCVLRDEEMADKEKKTKKSNSFLSMVWAGGVESGTGVAVDEITGIWSLKYILVRVGAFGRH